MTGSGSWQRLGGRLASLFGIAALAAGVMGFAFSRVEAKRQEARAERDDAATAFKNPVTAGGQPIRMGDPFAFLAGGSYYLVGTTSEHEGFQIYRSPDLARWQKVGWALRKTPDFWVKDLFWAPEVRSYKGKYYMIYSGLLTGKPEPELRLGLAVSDQPEGPYSNLHAPWFDTGYSAIDGDIFVDADQKPYLFFSRNGTENGYAYGKIYGVALADDLSKPLGAPKLLMQASQPWELVHARVNRCNEGPTVFRHNGVYYMTYSANDTSTPAYGIGYATARSPLGPWKKSEANPLLKTEPGSGISGPGHNSIVSSPDGKELWIVYHTHADPAHPSQDRIVNADRISFGPDGAMHVTATRTPQPLPSGTK